VGTTGAGAGAATGSAGGGGAGHAASNTSAAARRHRRTIDRTPQNGSGSHRIARDLVDAGVLTGCVFIARADFTRPRAGAMSPAMTKLARNSISFVALVSLAGLTMADTAKDKATQPAAMPKAPAELTTVAKAMNGTWKCTGTAMDMAAGKEVPTKATIKNKADLDGWWIVSTFAETKKGGFKFTQLTSFDGTKWSRTMFDNMGGKETAESTGIKDQKMVWEGSSTSSMGTMKSRHTEEVKGPKEVHMSGEYSQDGKAWMKAYDVTCKK
jgi:hypothetical protein